MQKFSTVQSNTHAVGYIRSAPVTLFSRYPIGRANKNPHQTPIPMELRSFFKAACVAACVCALTIASVAQPYYLDSNEPPGGAGTPGDPFQSIAELNAVVGALSSGTTVYLARNGTYPGRILIASGATGVTVKAGPLPTGAKPIVLGSELVTAASMAVTGTDGTWQPHNAEVWKIRLKTDTIPRYIYVDNVLQPLARYPNQGEWLRNKVYRSENGLTTLYPLESTPFPQPLSVIVDADLWIRETNFRFSKRTITGIENQAENLWYDAIGLQSAPVDKAELSAPYTSREVSYYNWGFFLENKIEFLDAAGEWWFDVDDGWLYLYTGDTNGPAPTNVRASTHKNGIHVSSGSSAILVENIEFRHQYEDGVRIRGNCSNVTVQHCIFRELKTGYYDSGGAGNSFGHTVVENEFLNTYNVALYSWGGYLDPNVPEPVPTYIARNTFRDIAVLPGMNEGFGHQGLYATGLGYLVEDNVLSGIGYAPMAFEGKGVVRNNYLERGMAMLNDGGGIQIDKCDGLEIRNNIVNGLGDPLTNVVSAAPNFHSYGQITYGIYFGDNEVVNTTVDGNVIRGCDKGVHVDHAKCSAGAKITNNTLFDNRVQLSMTDFSNWRLSCGGNDDPDANQGGCTGPNSNYETDYADDVYKGNITYCLNSDQRCIEQSHIWPDSYNALVDFGTFSGNYYFNPFNEVTHYQYVKFCESGVTGFLIEEARTIPYTLAGWQAQVEADAGSFASPLHLKDRRIVALSEVPVTLLTDECNTSAAISRWTTGGQPVPTFLTEQGDSFLRFGQPKWVEEWGDGEAYVALIDVDAPPGELPGTYRFTYRMRSPGTDAIQLGPVFDSNGYVRYFKHSKLSPSWREYERFIEVADVTDNDKIVSAFQNTQLSLGAIDASPIDLDYVRVDRVTLDNSIDAEIAEDHILRYYCDLEGTDSDPRNTFLTGGVFEVPGGFSDCWSDVFGNIYRGNDEIELLEWESMVLFKVSNTFDYSNGYTVSATVETWTEDKNIKGTLYIPSGKTLIVDGATIGFARHGTTPTTCVYVHPGGNLRLINGAKFTSAPGSLCEPGMWDGVKVLGNGTSTGGGVIEMTTGAGISNALTGIKNYGSSSSAGGQMVLDGSVFDNNQRDIHRTAYGSAANPPADQVVSNCSFITTRPLLDPLLSPTIHVALISGGRTFFNGCIFANLQSELPEPEDRGMGLSSVIADVIIEPLNDDAPRTRFENLFEGVWHEWGAFTHTFFIDRTDFVGCSRSAHAVADMHSTFARNVVEVRGTESSWPPNRGTYMHGCNLFEYEDNTFIGMDDGAPKAGSVFSNCSASAESVYHNQYDGFDGDDGTNFSAGLVISGTNSNTDGSAGLTWKCNTFSSDAENDHDVAFTGEDVLVAEQQGSDMSHETLAGNTFLELNNNCTGGNESRHFYVKPDYDVNEFHYWYHEPEPTREFAPLCASSQIVQATQYHETIIPYEPDPVSGSCPSQLGFLMDDGDLEDEIIYAEEQKETLSEVYDNWRDGGSTEGLVQFIQDTDNDSYDVRNELMLVAPSVSIAAWEEVFERTPAMNPWHIAQALIANSPLQSEVLRMLPEYDFHPYYEALVLDAQNEGTSMHNIYLSEIAYFNAQQSRALDDLTRKALRSADTTDLINARTWHNDHPVSTSTESMVSICYVLNDLQRARQIVDAELIASPYRDYWEVHDLYLSLLENDEGPLDLDYTGQMSLLPLALSDDRGSGEAQAWLTLLGGSFEDNVILPTYEEQRIQSVRDKVMLAPPVFINVHPNPSDGPVVVAMNLPEGSDGGEVRITDPQGRLIHQQRFQGEVQLLELDTRNLTTGAYAAELVADGIRIGVAKFHLIH